MQRLFLYIVMSLFLVTVIHAEVKYSKRYNKITQSWNSYPEVTIRSIQFNHKDSLLAADVIQTTNTARWTLQMADRCESAVTTDDTVTIIGLVVIPPKTISYTAAGFTMVLYDTGVGNAPFSGITVRCNSPTDTLQNIADGFLTIGRGDIIKITGRLSEFPTNAMNSLTQFQPIAGISIDILNPIEKAPLPPPVFLGDTVSKFYVGPYVASGPYHVAYSTGEQYESMIVEFRHLTKKGNYIIGARTMFEMTDGYGNTLSSHDASRWFTTTGAWRDTASIWALPPDFATIDTIRGLTLQISGSGATRGYLIAPMYQVNPQNGTSDVSWNTNVSWYLNASSGANGTISPSGIVTVNDGSSQQFTITPNSGYHVDSVIVDGVKVDSVSSYTFFNVTSNHTIRVTFKANDLTYGLVAYYPFNGNTNDESGNGNNGTVSGATLTTDRFGNINKSYLFDGSTSFIGKSNPVSLPVGNSNRSVGVWVNLKGPNSTNKTQCAFFYGTTLADGQSFGMEIEGNPINPRYPYFLGWGQDAMGKTVLNFNDWYFYVITFDGSYLKIFINGKQDTVWNLSLNTQLNADGLLIGKVSSNDGNHSYFNGTLDDIRIYNRALYQSEIDSLYHEGGWDAINSCPGTPTISYSGKTYNTVQIGNQCWMKENLNVGTMIAGSTNQTNNGTIEKYCYNNDTNNCNIYGGLYQWNEAMQFSTIEGTQGICPTGWHIPTTGELNTLRLTVDNNGNALKAVGQGLGGGSGTNSSGFSALLSGYRIINGTFFNLDYYTFFWSSSPYSSTDAYYIRLYYNLTNIYSGNYEMGLGYCIRCLKDTEEQTYIFHDSIVGNGTITKNPNQTSYSSGSTVVLTATPDSCYHFVNWSGDTISTQNPITVTMNSDKNIYANFAINKDTIIATNGANGTITPSGVVDLDCGASQRFTFSPSPGYYVDSVRVDGITVDSTQGYTFSNVSTNHTIHVTFKEYLSSISGKKYHDLNGNGQFDSGEPGLLNWQITLKKSDSATIDTTVTDSNGNYSFSSVTSGTHIVREIQQGGWIQTSVNPDTITVTSGSAVTDINFGNGHRSSICGVKYEDKNGNGYRDAGELGLQGWTIVLGGTMNGTAVTDPSGNFCFTNLPAGYYIVNEAQQGGWKQTQGGYSIQLSSGIDTVCNFGNFRYGSISGIKFHDLNGDGAMAGPDSGLSGWKIFLEKDGTPFTMKTTSFDGSYSFDSLMYGVYRLSEEERGGWIQTVYPTKNDTVVSGKTFINRNFGNVFGVTLDILAKWNMVSLPLGVLDNRKSIVFPNAVSSAFAFEGGYQSKTNLLNGIGYWLKFDSAQSINLIGGVIAEDTISVHAGWNMIGSISDTISTSCIVPVGTLIQSSYFGYLNGYVSSDMIFPGKAYWVKVSTDGMLILKGCSGKY